MVQTGTGILVTSDPKETGLAEAMIEDSGTITSTEALERCIKSPVLNAKRNVKFLSSPLKANLYTAENALKSISLRGFR